MHKFKKCPNVADCPLGVKNDKYRVITNESIATILKLELIGGNDQLDGIRAKVD